MHQIIPTSYVIFALLAAAAAVFVVSMVLFHHWEKYGYDEAMARKAKKFYLSGLAVLAALAAVSTLIYFQA